MPIPQPAIKRETRNMARLTEPDSRAPPMMLMIEARYRVCFLPRDSHIHPVLMDPPIAPAQKRPLTAPVMALVLDASLSKPK